VIDWHSHILPGVDDGSRDIDESLELLKMLKEQGIGTVVATPHFYANDESPDSFCERRNAAYNSLVEALPEGAPLIRLGAEVRYYPGIGRMSDLKKLCIEGTKLLLLEMPVSKWTEFTVRELIELAGSREITLVLAHIERYLSLQKPDVWRRLYESGILMQVNASFFTGFGTKHKAINYLSEGKIHFVGSDTHNTTSRPPIIDKAFEIISKKLGEDFLCRMNEYGHSVLAKK